MTDGNTALLRGSRLISNRRARLVVLAALGFSTPAIPGEAAPGAQAPDAQGPSRQAPGVPAPGAPAPGAPASGPAPPPSSALATDVASPALFEPVLTADTDALLLPSARRPPHRPLVIAATRIRARADTLAAVLLNPASMREALPALVRADVIATRPGPRPDAWPDRLIAWEIEIPLFNLTGKGWLRQQSGAVELTLVEGAFSPGHARFRFAPATDAGTTVVTCEIQIDAESSNWIFRRVARHDPWSETAMSAATAWILLRAVALRAEAAPGTPPARPHAPIQPPVAGTLDGSALGAPALVQLRGMGTLATVKRAANGRLAWASVEVPVPGSPPVVASRLAAPEAWRVFPGWKSVKRVSSRAAPGAPRDSTLIEVDDNVTFVDLDATWALASPVPSRATAVDGAIRGAILGWDAVPGDSPGTSLAVLSMHPHLDAAGFAPRRLIAAEPLLEHAIAAAMTYVNAAAVADSFANSWNRTPARP